MDIKTGIHKIEFKHELSVYFYFPYWIHRKHYYDLLNSNALLIEHY